MEGINQVGNSVPQAPQESAFETAVPTPGFGGLRAGNTTTNLQPGFGPRTSEVIHSSTIGNKPEPVEEPTLNTVKSLTPAEVAQLSTTAKLILENEAPINAALAEQGEQLNRAAILEAATLPNPTVAAVEGAKTYAADVVNGTDADVRIELADLKQQINDSFSEVASLLLDLATRFDLLDERINRYNMKSSHKI